MSNEQNDQKMKKIAELTASKIEKLNQDFEQQMKDLITFKAQTHTRLNTLFLLESKIEEFAQSQGLTIENIHSMKTGPSWSKWEEGDALMIAIKFGSNGKFRFIKDQGYDSRGAAKNQKTLEAKAQKLEGKFSEIVGYSCSVNPYSLQEDHQVLLDFWI